MSQALHPMLNIAVKAARAAGAIINRAALDLDLLQGRPQGPQRLRHRSRSCGRRHHHRHPARGLPRPRASWPRSRAARMAPSDSEFTWIIDPLDGTTNFLHGFPVYAVSIALAHRGLVQQAVVYDPTRNDLFFASRGRGAFLNDRRLRVSKRIRMADALIGTGFPFRRGDNFQRYLKMFEEVMQSCAGLRRPGAAALDLCYVAAGCYDGFFETGLQPLGRGRRLADHHRGRWPDRQLHRRGRLPATSAKWWPATRRSTGSWCSCSRRTRGWRTRSRNRRWPRSRSPSRRRRRRCASAGPATRRAEPAALRRPAAAGLHASM